MLKKNLILVSVGVLTVASLTTFVFSSSLLENLIEKISADINHSIILHVNGEPKVFYDSITGATLEPIIYNGRTYLPLRALGEEVFNSTINWDNSTKTINIIPPNLNEQITPTPPVLNTSPPPPLPTPAPNINTLEDIEEYSNLTVKSESSTGNTDTDNLIKTTLSTVYDLITAGKSFENGDFTGKVYPDSPIESQLKSFISYTKEQNLKSTVPIDTMEIVANYYDSSNSLVGCNVKAVYNTLDNSDTVLGSMSLIFTLINKDNSWQLYNSVY